MFAFRCLAVLLLPLLPLLAGCSALTGKTAAGPARPEFTVKAQARQDAATHPAARWVILPGSPHLDPGDMLYAEFARSLEEWLRREGREVVRDPAKADTAVFLIYDHRWPGGTALSYSAKPVDLPLAPAANGKERALRYWSPLSNAPGYAGNKYLAGFLMLQAVPLRHEAGTVMMGDPLWTVSAEGGNGAFDALRPCIPYLFAALQGLPGHTLPPGRIEKRNPAP